MIVILCLVLLKLMHNCFYKVMRIWLRWASQGAQEGKNPPANAGDKRDAGLTPACRGQEDPLGQGMAARSSVLAWEIPWTEEPGGTTAYRAAQSQTQLGD